MNTMDLSIADLKEVAIRLLVGRSVFQYDADTVVQRLIDADRFGYHDHGIASLPATLDCMVLGDVDPRARVLTVQETPAIAVLDGSRALGPVAMTKAVQVAVEKARAIGTGTVAVSNSQAIGVPSLYTRLAVAEGMIAFCTTSTGGATLPLCGCAQPSAANHPFSWAIPTKHGPIVTDNESCDLVSDSPLVSMTGFGLSFAMSILAGPLSAGRMPLHKTRTPSADGSQHFIYVIDPRQFADMTRFEREVGLTVQELHELPPAPNVDRIRLPGEESAEKATQRAETIPVAVAVADEIRRRATEKKIAVPW
jgi:LDH2 family malate/lactate/ureidoglycolate dehydrogenase